MYNEKRFHKFPDILVLLSPFTAILAWIKQCSHTATLTPNYIYIIAQTNIFKENCLF